MHRQNGCEPVILRLHKIAEAACAHGTEEGFRALGPFMAGHEAAVIQFAPALMQGMSGGVEEFHGELRFRSYASLPPRGEESKI